MCALSAAIAILDKSLRLHTTIFIVQKMCLWTFINIVNRASLRSDYPTKLLTDPVRPALSGC